MKADLQILSRVFGLAIAASSLFLTGCLEGDEQLHQTVRGLRAEVQKAKETQESLVAQLNEAQAKIKQLESQPATSNTLANAAPADSNHAAELQAVQQKVVELEGALAEARSGEVAGGLTAESLRQLAKELQTDLMTKVNELSDQVQAKIPSADLQEVTVKRIHPPQELATAFTSAITFTFLDGNRQPLPVRFPVQAGLDGSWRVPTVEDVQKIVSGVASGELQSATPSQGLASAPAAPAGGGGLAGPASAGAGRPTFDKQADGSIVINWDANAAPAPPPPMTTGTPSPVGTPAPGPAPATPRQPAVPAPVMPVQQDIIVRFD
jgi:hypothetical protein